MKQSFECDDGQNYKIKNLDSDENLKKILYDYHLEDESLYNSINVKI
jgi:hypothetical protein